jgi:hypothetical protein
MNSIWDDPQHRNPAKTPVVPNVPSACEIM